MSKSKKSAEAREQLEELFHGLHPTKIGTSGSPFDPFDDSEPEEEPEPLARLPVWISNRIELRGYPNAAAFMARMERAWGVEWLKPEAGRLVARLPEGWTSYFGREGVQNILDKKGVVRARSLVAEAERSWLKVLPRYYIDARKGFDFGRYTHSVDDSDPDISQWEGFVMDREKSYEVYQVVSSSAKADLERARRELELWLEANFPQYRDPFAYWSDCTERGLLSTKNRFSQI